MRISLNQIVLALAAGVLALSASSLAAQAADDGIGADYNARNPAMCADRTQPAEGAPSHEQLLDYLRCTMEGIGDGRLYLVENLSAEITGEGRAFDPQNDYYENIDRTALIYPVSGSLLRFNCEVVTSANEGANCDTYQENMATGVCYKMTSGDWNCRIADLSQVRTEGVAAPQ